MLAPLASRELTIYKPGGRAAAPTILPPDPKGAHNENPSLVALGKNRKSHYSTSNSLFPFSSPQFRAGFVGICHNRSTYT